MRSVVIGSLRTYARRYAAAVVAIVLAVGFIVAINAMSASARDGVRDEVGRQYTGADVVVTTGADDVAVQNVRDVAARTSGVTGAATNWTGYVSGSFDGRSSRLAIGTVADDERFRWQPLAAGAMPSAPNEALLSVSRAERHDMAPGDTFVLNGPTGPQTFTVSGIADGGGGTLGAAAYLPEATIAQFDDFVSAETVVLATEPDAVESVVRALRKAVPVVTASPAAVHIHKEQVALTNDVDVLQLMISVFGGISLFVGALVIANTFTILLAQRARELALLRCVGSTQGQLMRSVVTEALLIGGVASLTGIGAGYLLALGGVAALTAAIPSVPMGSVSLGSWGVAVPLVVGVLVTVGASAVPARRAARLAPLAALQPHEPVVVKSRATAARAVCGLLLVLVGGGTLFVASDSSVGIAMAGGMLSFIGVLALGPVVVPAAIRGLAPVVRRLGVPGQIAVSNAVRNPRRTAATSTALLVGVTLISAVVTGAASVKHKTATELDEQTPLDLTVVAAATPLSDDVVRQVRDVPGVAEAVVLPGVRADVNERATITVLGVDGDAHALVHGGLLGEIAPDEIVIPTGSDAFPLRFTGSNVWVGSGEQSRQLAVREVEAIGPAALVDPSTLRDLGLPVEPRGLWIAADPDADAGDVTSDVTAITDRSGLELEGGLPMRSEINQVLDIMLAVTVGLLAIAVFIALVGIGNTLSLSVIERVRENALLRALGLPRSGLRSMLAYESLLMAVVASLLGVGLGVLYAAFGSRALTQDVFSTPATLKVPWQQLAVIVLVAAAAGLLACVLPSRRAAAITPAAGLVAD